MTTRRRNLLLLLATLALAGGGAYLTGSPDRSRDVLDAVPDHTFLLVTLDLPKLRASPFAAELASLHEVTDVSQTCGFDPMARAKMVAIAIPEAENGEFGLALTHDLTRDEMSACARNVTASRGTSFEMRQDGPYVLLESTSSVEPGPPAQIAYRDGAPLLIGRGAWLGSMRAALDGREPRVLSRPAHAALREVAGANAATGARPSIVATAVLPKGLRDRLRKQMAGEADTERGVETMDAVLAVSEVAVAVTTGGAEEPVKLFAELRCERAGACETVRAFVDRKRVAFASVPMVKALGFAPLLDAIQLSAQGEVLEAHVELAAGDVSRVLSALKQAWSSPAAPARPVALPPSSGSAPAPHADEVLGARDGGGPKTMPRR